VSWRDARTKTEEHAPGVAVAQPGVRRGCWATCTGAGYSVRYAVPRSCSLQARTGKLTCHAHRARERDAQALKASLEQEAAE
jgi:hypothetical protein